MAGRKKKNTVDYFPHYIGEGKKIQFIEAKYGNDGYASWFKILESLAKTPDHYINLNDEIEKVFLANKCKIKLEVLEAILDDLAMLGSINKILWKKRIIWSEIFIESIKDTYKKRSSIALDFETLYNHLFSDEIVKISISDPEITKADPEIHISGGNCREIRKEEIRKEEIRNIPTLERSVEPKKTDENGLLKKPWEQYSPSDFDTPKNDLKSDLEFITRLGNNHAVTNAEILQHVENFFKAISITKESHTTLQGYRKHCMYWVNNKITNQKKYENNQTGNRRHEASRPTSGYGKL